ncbi:hypothetical protein HK405_003600, partial [Cladochytrium tenue]
MTEATLPPLAVAQAEPPPPSPPPRRQEASRSSFSSLPPSSSASASSASLPRSLHIAGFGTAATATIPTPPKRSGQRESPRPDSPAAASASSPPPPSSPSPDPHPLGRPASSQSQREAELWREQRRRGAIRGSTGTWSAVTVESDSDKVAAGTAAGHAPFAPHNGSSDGGGVSMADASRVSESSRDEASSQLDVSQGYPRAGRSGDVAGSAMLHTAGGGRAVTMASKDDISGGGDVSMSGNGGAGRRGTGGEDGGGSGTAAIVVVGGAVAARVPLAAATSHTTLASRHVGVAATTTDPTHPSPPPLAPAANTSSSSSSVHRPAPTANPATSAASSGPTAATVVTPVSLAAPHSRRRSFFRSPPPPADNNGDNNGDSHHRPRFASLRTGRRAAYTDTAVSAVPAAGRDRRPPLQVWVEAFRDTSSRNGDLHGPEPGSPSAISPQNSAGGGLRFWLRSPARSAETGGGAKSAPGHPETTIRAQSALTATGGSPPAPHVVSTALASRPMPLQPEPQPATAVSLLSPIALLSPVATQLDASPRMARTPSPRGTLRGQAPADGAAAAIGATAPLVPHSAPTLAPSQSSPPALRTPSPSPSAVAVAAASGSRPPPPPMASYELGLYMTVEISPERGRSAPSNLVSRLVAGSPLASEFTLYAVGVRVDLILPQLLKPHVGAFGNAEPHAFVVYRRYSQFEALYIEL